MRRRGLQRGEAGARVTSEALSLCFVHLPSYPLQAVYVQRCWCIPALYIPHDTASHLPFRAACRRSMPLLAPQAFGEAWPLSMTSWLYMAFSPSSLASPSIQDLLTSNGIDLSRLDQSVANLTYYTSAQFIADVSGKQTAWSHVCACVLGRDVDGGEGLEGITLLLCSC